MSAYEPSTSFKHAAHYLSNATPLFVVPNATKLELYGLYKYLTVAYTPTTSRPSIFDFAGRAKWDAWSAAGQTYADRVADAEGRYLAIARDLGWSEDIVPTEPVEEHGEEGIWDTDEDTARASARGSEGMGNVMSTMVPVETEGINLLSSLAISGNAEQMKLYLDANADVDVDQLDENGYTPLHLACDRGNREIAELLLGRGADKEVKDADDLTALELAEISGHDELVAVLRSAKRKTS